MEFGIIAQIVFFTLGFMVLVFSVDAFVQNVLNKTLLPKHWLKGFWSGLITNKWFWLGFIVFLVLILIFNP